MASGNDISVFRLSFHELRGSVFTAYFILKKKFSNSLRLRHSIGADLTDSIVHRESIRSRDWQRFLHENINTLVHIPIYNVGACFFLSPYRLAGFFSLLVIMQSTGSPSTAERSNRGYISIRERVDMFSYFYEPLIRVGKKNLGTTTSRQEQ